MRLTEDQKDLIRDAIGTDLWDAVVALCEQHTARIAEKVLTSNLDKSGRDLVLNKARLEGAQTVVAALRAAKQNLKR